MKALASDFDGTLYFEDGIKDSDQQAIIDFQKDQVLYHQPQYI